MAYAHAALVGGALDVLSNALNYMIRKCFPQIFAMVKVRPQLSFVPEYGSGLLSVGFLVHVKS